MRGNAKQIGIIRATHRRWRRSRHALLTMLPGRYQLAARLLTAYLSGGLIPQLESFRSVRSPWSRDVSADLRGLGRRPAGRSSDDSLSAFFALALGGPFGVRIEHSPRRPLPAPRRGNA